MRSIASRAEGVLLVPQGTLSSKKPDLSSRQIRLFCWQREKDSNPHKQSQSLSCYPYTIPLFTRFLAATKVIISELFQMSTLFFSFSNFFFIPLPSGQKHGDRRKRKPQGVNLKFINAVTPQPAQHLFVWSFPILLGSIDRGDEHDTNTCASRGKRLVFILGYVIGFE